MKRVTFTCTNPTCRLHGKDLVEYASTVVTPRGCPVCHGWMVVSRETEAGLGDMDSFDLDAVTVSPKGARR